MIPRRMRWPLAVIALVAIAAAAGPSLPGLNGANLLGGLSRDSDDKQIMFETVTGDPRVSTTMGGNPEGVSTSMGGTPEGVSTSMSGNPEGIAPVADRSP